MMPPAIQVLADVAAAHGLTLQELRAPGRKGGTPLFLARRDAARRLRDERGLSAAQIGRFLGGRDHSTIYRMLDDDYRQRHMTRIAARQRAMREAQR
jgi:chromosomal replication initiation ATPase DnaA